MMKSKRKSLFDKILLLSGLMIVCMLMISGCGQEGQAAKEDLSVQTDQETVEDSTARDNQISLEDQSVLEDTQEPPEAGYIFEKVQSEEGITDEGNPLAGKRLSIMGDSLSTFESWIPEGFVVYYPYVGEVSSVEDTWWMRLISDTDMILCSNASSSGSTCVGDSMAEDNPKFGCSGYRIQALTGDHGEYPDIILVYMGTNDFLVSIPPGDNDGHTNVEEGMITNFSDAYCLILDKLASTYPTAQIFCCGLAQIGVANEKYVLAENNLGLTSLDYNKCIEQIAKTKGYPYIDLYNCGIEPENMNQYVSDGVHFTPDGMKLVKECIEAGLYDYFPAS